MRDRGIDQSEKYFFCLLLVVQDLMRNIYYLNKGLGFPMADYFLDDNLNEFEFDIVVAASNACHEDSVLIVS